MNRPFNEIRYRVLVEGLEITEVLLSKVTASAETLRFDPEYYQKQYMHDEIVVREKSEQFYKFTDLGIRVDASAFYPSIESFYDQGALPFLRVADVDTVIDFQTCTRIPEELCNRFKTLSKVYPGDIVFTKGGSVARIGLVTEEAAVSRDLIFLNSAKLEEADRIFLYVYFQTDFFYRSLIRSSSQTAQAHLTITLVRDLPIFSATSGFKEQCLLAVQEAFRERNNSIELLAQSENLLLESFGLKDWDAQEPLAFVRSSKDTFMAGRLDSEYFSPKVMRWLDALSRDKLTIADVAPVRRDRFVLNGDEYFNYIEIGGVRSDGTVKAEQVLQSEAPSRASQLVEVGDVITSTVRPIRRLSALVSSEQDGNVCSSGFVVLQPRSIPGEVLLTYLRLKPVCELMDLHTSASLYPAISERDLAAIPIPNIDIKVQGAVTAAVQSAQRSQKRAVMLLQAAKQAIEVAIEHGEAVAIYALTEKLKEQ